MRKIITIFAALCIVTTALFAVSYTNNTYHKLAEEYTEKAQKALDAGYYELAEEYAAEAKKNAALSEEFIAKMIARSEAEEAINAAKTRLEESLAAGADPASSEYKEALGYLNKAQGEFDSEDYVNAKSDAEKVKSVLSDEYLKKLAEQKAAAEAEAKKNEAKEALQKAKSAITAAEAAGMDDSYDVFNEANSKYRDAQKDFEDEAYEDCIKKANEIVEMLSPEAVEKEIQDAKSAAEEAVKNAKKALDDAEAAGVDKESPAYKKALSDYNKAVEELENEEYKEAKEDADKVVDALNSELLEAVKARKDAEDAISKAKERIEAAEKAGLDPENENLKEAKAYYGQALKDFEDENYADAKDNAEQVLSILTDDVIEEATSEAKKAAEKALADARKALDAAEEAGMDPNSDLYKQAREAYDKARAEYADKKYDDAKADAEKVCELLNEDVLDNLKAMTEAAKAIAAAKARLAYAENAGLDDSYPNYGEAVDYYNQAIDDFNKGKYEDAKDSAEQVLTLLPVEDIDSAVAKAKKDAEDSLEAAQKALEKALESGLDPESDEYKAAKKTFDDAKQSYEEGDYTDAKEKADKVPGMLDVEAIKAEKLRKEAEDAIAAARERIMAANNAGLDTSYDPYRDALAYYRKAQSSFTDEDYQAAIDYANQVKDLLSDEAIENLLENADAERAKSAAEKALNDAKDRLDKAESMGLGRSDPAYNAALAYYNRALDEFEGGNYPEAQDDAEKVLELLPDSYIDNLLDMAAAEKAISEAKERLEYAESINAPRDFPIAYNAANAYYEQALDDYTKEQYKKAVADAQKVLDALADIHEMTPLPKFYIVRPWAESKDCFWNISGRSYVYNNPWLWENLYEVNKDNIPDRENPNLILPGMKMEIPSITGEYRDGVYSPDVEYETFRANR